MWDGKPSGPEKEYARRKKVAIVFDVIFLLGFIVQITHGNAPAAIGELLLIGMEACFVEDGRRELYREEAGTIGRAFFFLGVALAIVGNVLIIFGLALVP